MEFKTPYVLAMREQAPKMFMEMRRAGTLEDHLQAKAMEADRMLKGLLAQAPKDERGQALPAARQAAEEVVRATLIEFPDPETTMREPPEDLMPQRSRA